MSTEWMKLGQKHRQELISCVPGALRLMKRIHKLEIELLAEQGNKNPIRKKLEKAISQYKRTLS